MHNVAEVSPGPFHPALPRPSRRSTSAVDCRCVSCSFSNTFRHDRRAMRSDQLPATNHLDVITSTPWMRVHRRTSACQEGNRPFADGSEGNGAASCLTVWVGFMTRG
jgi:hypothetical protein